MRIIILFIIGITAHAHADELNPAYEALLDDVYSKLNALERNKLLSSNFFDGYFDGYYLQYMDIDSERIETVGKELYSLQKTGVKDDTLRTIIANELKLRELNKAGLSRRAWLYRSVAYLKEKRLTKQSSNVDQGVEDLVDIIEYLKKQSALGLLPFKIKTVGSLDRSTITTYPFEAGTRSLHNIIEFTCFYKDYPNVYFSYPYMIFEGDPRGD